MDRKSVTKHRTLDYVPRQESSPARATIMFFLFQPATIGVVTEVAIRMIISIGRKSHTDIHAFGLMSLIALPLLIAPICLIIAVVKAFRRKGGWPAFFQGLAWNVLLVVVVSLIFFVLVK